MAFCASAIFAWRSSSPKRTCSPLTSVRKRVEQAGLTVDESELVRLVASVWPTMVKMQERDRKYTAARAAAFTTDLGREYIRELSIDELPGLTTPNTIAIMLALCEAMDMRVHYVAPAFGFQKNFPFADQEELRRRVSAAWDVCKAFDVSIGFHSGSGKSPANYRLVGDITGGRLEIKTSGRYTYEMGVALSRSHDAKDQALWRTWFDFTRELAASSAFSHDDTEQNMARKFIVHALLRENQPTDIFTCEKTCRQALSALPRDPDCMFWFEYNFLFVLAPGGKPDKQNLGDHSLAGYTQRAKCYAISPEARLLFAQGIANYIINLAEYTSMSDSDTCAEARRRLNNYTSYQQLVLAIAPQRTSQLRAAYT